MTSPRPQFSREAALVWLHEHPGSTQGDCIDALCPGISDAERAVVENRLRKWVWRDRKAGGARVAAPARGPMPQAPTPAAREVRATAAAPVGEHPAVGLERIPALRRQLSQAETALDAVIEDRAWRVYPQVDARRFTVAAELEREMERVRQVVSLEPRPGALMAWLDSHREFVARGADLERRRLARREEE